MTLLVSMGTILRPGAITPNTGNATLSDYMFNTWSEGLRVQIFKSGTPRRISIFASPGIPAFVSSGGRWGAATAQLNYDSTVAGQRVLYADTSANDGTITLVSQASPGVAGPYQQPIATFNDTGAAIASLDTGMLGLGTVSGVLTLGGLGAKLRLADALLTGFYTDLNNAGGTLVATDQAAVQLFSATSSGFIINNLPLSLQGAAGGLLIADRATSINAGLYRTGGVVHLDGAGGTASDILTVSALTGAARTFSSLRVGTGGAGLAASDASDGAVVADGASAVLQSRDRADATKWLNLFRNGTIRLGTEATTLWTIDQTTGLITQDALTALTAGTSITLGATGASPAGSRIVKPTGQIAAQINLTATGAVALGATIATLAASHRPAATIALAATKLSGGLYTPITLTVSSAGLVALQTATLANTDVVLCTAAFMTS